MDTEKLQKGSLLKGKLPEGCHYCGMGAKLVLLVTGKCMRRCFYCPLSGRKRGRDVVYADELRVREDDDVLYEARLIDALGAGITGGDPLHVAERTDDYIELLKNTFGERFHIHLYTSCTDLSVLEDIEDSGLDEIRFHPPQHVWTVLEKTDFAEAFNQVRRGNMDLGVEVPVLPDKEREMVALVKNLDELGVEFLNLDELEFSETNWMKLRKKGYDTKDDIASAVSGCDRLAKELLSTDVDMSLHYCTSSFKDAVQLRNRIMRRAKNVAGDWEIITPEGLLFKGIVEGTRLVKMKNDLMERFEIPNELMNIDYEKSRLEVAPWILKEISSELEFPCFLIEEYPTADRLEVEREPLEYKKK
ncbi:MAG: radical SAM protein [Methanobacteriota archaeon]|nr:MAG: radical SAM protein [Euryarchaeota archaeon]